VRVSSTIRAAFSAGDMRAYRSNRTTSASDVVSAAVAGKERFVTGRE